MHTKQLRAAIYARFSTDLQSARSIDDQIALCRGYAEREGLSVISVFQDAAISGASVHGRDGLQELLAAARTKAFDILIVEAFDRISRRQADSHAIFDLLAFNGIEIRAVHDGRADPVTFGLRAIVAQLQRDDGAKKVRRGMAGVIRDGRHAGGRAYGYKPVPGKPGILAMDDAEAVIVRRIFNEYVDGSTPREIAAALNHDRIPAPRGSKWNASTINGNASRGNGILLNPLYAGRIVWNRLRMVKNPDTGKRVSRLNDAGETQTATAEHLRIIDDATFESAGNRKRERGKLGSTHTRKPPRILTGLLRCGVCGGGISSVSPDRKGRTRLQCSAVRESGTCNNRRTAYRDAIEARVLCGLQKELLNPDIIPTVVAEYNAERQRLAKRIPSKASRLRTRASDVQREIDRLIEAVAKGRIDADLLGDSMHKLKAERDSISAELTSSEDKKEIVLQADIVARYKKSVSCLQDILAEGPTPPNSEVFLTFRDLIERVTLHPKEGGGVEIEVAGRLAAFMNQPDVTSQVSVCRMGGSGGRI